MIKLIPIGNSIEESGAEILSEALKNNRTLTELNLSGNEQIE